MKAFAHHLVYEFRGGIRDKSQLLMNYLFPLVFSALVGGLMTRINPGFGKVMLSAMVIFAFMSSTLIAMPSAFVASRNAGLLRSYRINGVPSWAALAAPALATLAHMSLFTGIVAVLGKLAFGASLPADWLHFGLVWLVAALAIAGLGTLIAAMAPSERAAVLEAQLIFIPSMIVSGLMMPTSILPPGLAKLAEILPATHAMRAFAGGPGSTLSLGLLALGAVLSFTAALMLYEWDPHNGRPAARKLLGLAALLPYAATLLI